MDRQQIQKVGFRIAVSASLTASREPPRDEGVAEPAKPPASAYHRSQLSTSLLCKKQSPTLLALKRAKLQKLRTAAFSPCLQGVCHNVGWVDPGALNFAALTGLKPDTRYYYAVGDLVISVVHLTLRLSKSILQACHAPNTQRRSRNTLHGCAAICFYTVCLVSLVTNQR